VSWGSPLVAGKLAGYTSMLFKTNCWADQTAFLATQDEYDEFLVHPSERSVEREIEDLLKTDQATRADMAVALEELKKEIAEHAAAEKRLRESEERYRALVENVAYGITLVDAEHNIVMTNSAQGRLFQKDPAELVGAKCYNQFEQRGEICAYCPGEEAMKSHESVEVETEGVRTDGSAFPVRIRAFPLYDSDDNPAGFIEVVEDITERKKAEQTLRESEAKMRSIFRAAPVGIGLVSNRIILDANEQLCRITGYSRDEMLGKSARILYPTDEDYEFVGREKYRQIAERGTGTVETRLKRKDGHIIHIVLSSTALDPADLSAGVTFTVLDVTESKQAEEALRQSEEKYRQLVETMAEGLGVTDANYIFTYVNATLSEMLGRSSDEMIGHHILEFVHPDSKEAMSEQIELRRKGVIKSYDIAWKAKDGTKVYTMASPQGLFDSEGNFIGSFGVITDITERKRTESELMRSREMLQNVLDTIPARVFWKDRECRFLGCNKLFAHDAGKESPAELIGKTDYDMPWTKEESDLYREHDLHVMESDTPEYHIIERQLQADGRHAWVDTTKVPIHDEEGNVIGMLGTYEDITDRKRTEEELVKSQQMLRNVLENIPVRVFWKDTNSMYLGCNRVFAQDAGVDMDEIVGRTDYELAWTKSEADFYRQCDRRVMESDTPEYHIIEPQLHADGTPSWLDTNKVPLHDAEGNVIGILGTYEDITVRKSTQEALEASQEQLSLAFEAATDGLWDLHLDTDEAYFSPRYYRMLGYQPSEFAPSYDAWAALIHPHDRPAVEDELQQCIQKKADNFEAEFRMCTRDGGYRWVLSRGKVVRRDEEGRPLRIVGTHVDITERKEAEEERNRLLKALAAKNEELESIVYVSSHDLRSPLVNIQGFSGELHRSCHQLVSVLEQAEVDKRHKTEITRILDEDIPASLGYISNSTTKMDVLLRGLLKLSRLGSVALKIRRLNMNSILRDVVKGMQYQIKKSGARVTVGMLPPCTADAAQVSQVFANLLDNAIKYRHPERPPRINVSGSVENGTALYSVKDNGIGIAPAHIDKVFEIFHRLDPHSEVAGEGLGLTIVRRMLDLMDGSIHVESKPGKGSTFYVGLPAAKEEEQ